MILDSLDIELFRHIQNTRVNFGENITVISGQNGTGKSSVLGWVAQLCDYKGEIKRVNGEDFKENWSKVFRFCDVNDFDKKYKVKFNHLKDGNIEQTVLSTRYISSVNRYKCDFNRNITGKIKRAIDFPVIYLGLKRLIPLSTETVKRIEKLDLDFTKAETNLFNRLAKEILLVSDDKIDIEAIKSPNKKVLAIKTDNYNHLGNSAGQDNIGQIISSLISFNRLKEKLKLDYEGGVLLIDEIDSTLYAATQIKLIQVLNRYAESLKLQVIFTTHSIEILEYISTEINSNSFLGKKAKINFLEEIDKKVKNIPDPSIDWVKLKIKGQRGKKEKIIKIDFICEDKNAELWIKNLIQGCELKNLINPLGSNLPDTTLCEMAKSPNKIFKNHKYILDGDSKKRFNNKKKEVNICFLPGDYGVELIMFHFVWGLKESDEFWNRELNHTRQSCFMDYQNDGKQSTAKNWFNDKELKEDFFGRSYNKLFNRWKKDNKEALEKFHNDIRKII